MKNNFILVCLTAIIIFSSCQKSTDSPGPDPNNPGPGADTFGIAVNTWTFQEGSQTFKGVLALDGASLTTNPGENNKYLFGMLGAEKNSGFIFNIVLLLSDLDFTIKNYQTGIAGDLGGFYFSEDTFTSDNIYKSSNLDPGQVMNYTITSYDSLKDIVTITFAGEAKDINDATVNITNGKVTAKIER